MNSRLDLISMLLIAEAILDVPAEQLRELFSFPARSPRLQRRSPASATLTSIPIQLSVRQFAAPESSGTIPFPTATSGLPTSA